MGDNQIVLTTENNDKIQLIPTNGGVLIQILPVTNLPGQATYDIFSINLRKSSLKKLLFALNNSGKYSTDLYQNVIWLDKSGKINIHNKTNIREIPEYDCILGVDQSDEFIRLVSYILNGIPDELKVFADIKDEYVQRYLIQVVERPILLKSPKYWDDLGMSLGTAGYTEDAMNCFYKALQLDPDHHISKLNLATSLDEMGNTSKALELIQQVPDGTSRRNVIMANTLSSAGMELEAIPYYEKAVVEEPEFFVPYLRLLNILSSNDHPLFEYWLEKALEIHRRVPAIAHFYTNLLLQQQRIEELAEIDWLEGLQNTPSNQGVIGRDTNDPIYIALAQLNHKIALIYRDGDDQALPWAIQQLENIPRLRNLCMQAKLLAGAAAQSGHTKLISAAYEHVCPSCKEKENGIPRYLDTLLAKGFENQEDWDNAIKCCENVLASDPSHIETLNIYYWNLDNANLVENAIRTAEYLYTLAPSQPHLPYNIGYLHGKLGHLGKAEFYYLKQLELEPEHWVALENLSFIHLLSAKLNEGKEAFGKSLDLRRNEYLNSISDFSEDEIRNGDDILNRKSQKFSELLETAQKLQGDSTYALQLQKVNMADEVIIGANTAIERNPYSIDNMLATLGSQAQVGVHEVQFQLAFQNRGDYSMRLTELISLIPGFYDLPKEAQSSLIEGEKRFKETDLGDFFSVIVAFSKALEICIKQFVFDQFRIIYQYQFETNKQIVLTKTKLPRGYDKFVLFVEKGHFIGLGEMALVLGLCTQRENEGTTYIRHMREYLTEKKELQVLLVPEVVEKITILAKDYRNKAVHFSMFDREKARVAREIAIEVIASLRS